jgi:hypothetical protein
MAVAAQQPQRPMPTLPLTQLDERALAADLDNRTFTLTFAQPVPVRELLLLLVRGTSLSIVPDPSISGSFIGELKNVTVRQALALILPPLGLQYSVDGTFVRVSARAPETRIFDINYAATERTGTATIGGDGAARSAVMVSSSTKTDVFADLANGMRTLLSEHATFNVDRKAGLLQVTDFPERLDRVSVYLDAVHDRVLRQVQIDARVIEVELNDEKATGVDWSAVVADQVGDILPGQRPAVRPSLTGLRVTDLTKLLASLAAQGTVSVHRSHRRADIERDPADFAGGGHAEPEPDPEGAVNCRVGHDRAHGRWRDAGHLGLHARSRNARKKERRHHRRLAGARDGRDAQADRVDHPADAENRGRRGGAITCTNATTGCRRSRSA